MIFLQPVFPIQENRITDRPDEVLIRLATSEPLPCPGAAAVAMRKYLAHQMMPWTLANWTIGAHDFICGARKCQKTYVLGRTNVHTYLTNVFLAKDHPGLDTALDTMIARENKR